MFFSSPNQSLPDNTWFLRERDRFVYFLLRDHAVKLSAKVLIIGCADGSLISSLRDMGFSQICGIDSQEDAVEMQREQGIGDIYAMNYAKTTFKNNEFDVLIAPDICGHGNVQNEVDNLDKKHESTLMEWNRILKPGALFIACASRYPVTASTQKQTRSSVRKLLKKTRFNILRVSNWNFLLYGAVRFISPIYMNQHPKMFRIILSAEHAYLRFFPVPWGTDIFAVSRKKGEITIPAIDHKKIIFSARTSVAED